MSFQFIKTPSERVALIQSRPDLVGYRQKNEEEAGIADDIVQKFRSEKTEARTE